MILSYLVNQNGQFKELVILKEVLEDIKLFSGLSQFLNFQFCSKRGFDIDDTESLNVG